MKSRLFTFLVLLIMVDILPSGPITITSSSTNSNIATSIRVKVNNSVSLNPLSPEERAAWRRHNLQTLTESAALPFEEKLTILEDLEEITIAMGYQRDPATGRHRKCQ